MSDASLSALFPSVPVVLGGERLCLRPVILSELPAVERVLEAWRLLVATGGDFANAEAWEDMVDLCASSVGRDRKWLDTLSEDDFERLICLVLSVNEEIWKPSDTPDTGEAISWERITQRLVEHGHPFSAVQGYTIPQARAFLRETYRSEAEELARDIQAASFSMADQKSVAKAVKELHREH